MPNDMNFNLAEALNSQVDEKKILRENVKDLQRQLNAAQIRIKELTELVDKNNIL